jgi:hypothetical protein
MEVFMSKKTKQPPKQTVITLTLPDDKGRLQKEGTLLIQRGDLAQIFRFYHTNMGDITSAIRDAQTRINELEANPPVIEKVTAKPPQVDTSQDTPPEEPTIELPCKKGAVSIPMSHLKIVEGETDAVSYRIAMQIGARLMDGKLWDGQTPLRLKHVGEIFNRMKSLTDADFQLFTLSDFADVEEA